MRTFVNVVVGSVVLVMPVLSRAQTGQSPPALQPPFIAASAVGETRVTPDRAVVQVTVDSRAETAAGAGVDNRVRQDRVIAAVKAAGIASAQIRTLGYRVTPEYVQPERGKPPRVSAYQAHNTIQVEVRSVENVGNVIDAALAAGATNIGSVGLYSSNTAAARREAVQLAVAKARGEAESAATAAGGTLGTMVELTIDPGAVPRPVMQQVMVTSSAMSMGGNVSAAAPMYTPVEPGESLVLAFVRARWQFVPGGK